MSTKNFVLFSGLLLSKFRPKVDEFLVGNDNRNSFNDFVTEEKHYFLSRLTTCLVGR